jgi:GH15 family glucan-1,4-alpha-glucosidase
MVHDFYYPYVGLENHAAARGLRHRVGVWVDGQFSWLDDGSWKFKHDYPYESLVGHSKATNDSLGISLEFDDCVDTAQSAFLRNIHVINHSSQQRDVRFYMHQVFAIGGGVGGDTAQYLPEDNALLHYKGHRAFVVSGRHNSGEWFEQYSIGVYGIEGKEGTFKDAEDGMLSQNPVEHGSIDSVLGFKFDVQAHGSHRVQYWVAAGKSTREALVIHHRIVQEGLVHRLMATDKAWRDWLEPARHVIDALPEEYKSPFTKSLLITKAHIDKRGAVIASTDTTMLNYSRDSYAYCWPRDAALVLWPLVRMGYKDEPLHFFNFCRRALNPKGYLMHKYQADGALGSSWHPYVHEYGIVAPPIQEDETALVVFLVGQYFAVQDDKRMLKELYGALVFPMANFLATYIDETTKLPRPSYDLWERVFMTTTYTTSVVYAGLLAAVDLAEKVGESEDAVRWQAAADDMREAAHHVLFNDKKGYFYRGVLHHDNEYTYDEEIDTSAFYGAFMFGLFELDSSQIKTAHQTLLDTYSISGREPQGVLRYAHDDYNVVDPASLGNPWFITTLWFAQYNMEIGNDKLANEYVRWVSEKALPSGVLSEQINPFTNEFVSVAPLAWSQAEFVNTLLDMATKPPKIPQGD